MVIEQKSYDNRVILRAHVRAVCTHTTRKRRKLNM